MKIISILVSLFIVSFAQAVDYKTYEFNFASIVGEWESNQVSVPGEKQTLRFSADKSSKFVRTFKDGRVLSYDSYLKDIQMEEDIIILEYHTEEFGLTYKMVLSGWHVEDAGVKGSALYGMLFLYQEGRQYNGFPVSFRPKIDKS